MAGDLLGLGEFLRQQRMKRAISLRSVAETAEISPAYLSRMERGLVGRPSEEVLERISFALNIDRNQVLTLAGYVPDDYKLEAMITSGLELISAYNELVAATSSELDDTEPEEIDVPFEVVLRAFFSGDPDGEYYVRELSAAYDLLRLRLEKRKRERG